MSVTIVNLNTQVAVAIPQHLTRFRLAWAKSSECYRSEKGYHYFQEYSNDLYSVHYNIFDFTETAQAVFHSPTPAVIFHFLLKGKIQSKLTNTEEAITINPGTFQLILLPEGKTDSTIEKGITESFYIRMSDKYLENVLIEMNVLERLIQGLGYERYFGEALRPLLIDGKTESLLRNDLFAASDNEKVRLKLRQAVFLLLSQYEASLISGSETAAASPQISFEIETIRREIIEEPNKNIYSVGALAKRCSVSITTFQRYFKSIVGTPIREFVLEQCMAKARILLASTNDTLLDISEKIGYNDVGNMSKTFKQHYGITPIEYRKGIVSQNKKNGKL